MWKRIGVWTVAAVGAAGMVGFVGMDRGEALVPEPVLLASSVVADQNLLASVVFASTDAPFINCERCIQSECTGENHELLLVGGDGPDRSYSETTHGCDAGFCSVAHPSTQCGGPVGLTESEKKLLLDRYAGADIEALRGLARDLDEVAINSERSALQALGCNGGVVLNLPLSAEQIAQMVD